MAAPDVRSEDQQKINSFHRSWQRLKEISAELEGKAKLKDDCEDASNELILVEEPEIRFLVGECFYHAAPEEAEEKVQEQLSRVELQQRTLQDEQSRLQTETAELKKVLYGRFGTSINLEE